VAQHRGFCAIVNDQLWMQEGMVGGKPWLHHWWWGMEE
jgi:hypothetical protein